MRQASQQGGISQIIWVEHHESVSAVMYTKGQSRNVLWDQGDHILLWLLLDDVGFREAKEAALRARATGSFSPALWPVGRGFSQIHFHPS